MKRLLLVDDEIYIFNLFKRFSKNDFIVDYAPDGKRGLSLFNKNNYDLVITDFNMPTMNGIEMIKEIRKTDDKIPIFLLTGNREIMMDNIKIIYKPFDIKIIKNIIQSVEIV